VPLDCVNHTVKQYRCADEFELPSADIPIPVPQTAHQMALKLVRYGRVDGGPALVVVDAERVQVGDELLAAQEQWCPPWVSSPARGRSGGWCWTR